MNIKIAIERVVIVFLLCCFWQSGLSQVTKSEKEFQFAKKLYDDNLLILAAEQFQQYVITYPNNENSDNAQFLCGKAYFNEGKYKIAFNAFKRLELDYPQSKFLSEGRLKLAECQLALKDYGAAAEFFKRVAYFHSESEYAPVALLQSGLAYEKANSDAKAKDSFYQLITKYPDSPERIEAHLAIVNLHFKNNQLKEALNQIDGIFQVFGSDANDARVYWLRAELFRNLAQFDEAEKNYNALVSKYPKDKLAGKAYFQLGILYFRKGNYESAIGFFNQISASLPDSLLAEAYLKKAECYKRLDKLNDAKAVLEEASSLKSGRAPAITYNLALVNNDLGEVEKAESILQKLLAHEGFVQTELGFKALKLQLNILQQQNKNLKALSLIVAQYKNFNLPNERASLLFQKAEILQTKTKDYAAAIRDLNSFIESFPQNGKIDDAQFNLATCYLRLEQYRFALNEYTKYLEKYPAGDFHQESNDLTLKIRNTINLTRGSGLSDIAALFKSYVDNDSVDLDFKLAQIYFSNKDFFSAINHLKRARENASGEGNEIDLLLGKSFLALSEQAELADDSGLTQTYSDSALATFTELISDSTYKNEWVEFTIAKDKLRGYKQLDLTTYENWESRFPGGEYRDHVQFELANRSLRENSADSATLQTALQIYGKIAQGDRKQIIEEAAFKKLQCLANLKKDSLALAVSDKFLAEYPLSRHAADVLLLGANSAFNLNELAKSKKYLQRLIDEYYYSNLIEKAKTKLADIYIKNKEYRSAIDYYNSIFKEGFSRPLYNKAYAYENLGLINEALVEYIGFITANPNSSQKTAALFAVGRLATRTNNLSLAQEYYQSLLNSQADVSVKYKANFAIADILFQKKLFSEAKQYYTSALQFAATDSDGKAAYANSIRCQYKLKAFAQADSEVKKLKKRYKDTKEFEAQLLLDKGDALVADKNFPEAEKVYKDLRGDFKKTDWGAYGEFGLGAVYLITNHTEDALKILTKIPEKYPDSKVTPLAYYNLGDFYMKNQQVESAIHAFNKVRLHEKAGDLNEKALLYLIQSYHDARLYDQAIVVTREFLAAYPESEHAFRKKIDMAQFLMNLKEYERAIADLKKLLPFADKETEAEIQFYIGQCYKEMGDYSQAAVEYLKVKYLTQPTKLPWHVTALFESGRCLVKINQFPQAKKIFNRIVREQGSESSFGRFAIKQLQELDGKNETVSAETSNVEDGID